MKCLIIAAGRGSRLASKGDSKPLVELAGVPLIERVMLTTKAENINEFYVVLGYNGDKIKKRLSEFGKKQSLKITYINNPKWEEANGVSVLSADSFIDEPFILLMSDHLFDSAIIRDLIRDGIGDNDVKLAVDKRIRDNKYIDLDDVTKVLVKKDKIFNIGKNLTDYNAFDTGIFLCGTGLFSALKQSINKGDASLSGGIRELAANQKAAVFDIGNNKWIDVDDEDAFKKAEYYFSNI